MTFSFRAMTPEEIAERDRELAKQRARFSEGDADSFWIARAIGMGPVIGAELHYDHLRRLFDAGYVIAQMSEVTDKAVEQMRFE